MGRTLRRMRLLERCAGEAMVCAGLCTNLEVQMRAAGRRERAVLYGAEGDRWVRRATAYHQAVAVVREGAVGLKPDLQPHGFPADAVPFPGKEGLGGARVGTDDVPTLQEVAA